MAEPPATTPEQAGANGSDGPLGTNLYLLRPQPGFVSRPRLVERLQEGPAWGHFPAAGWCGSMHSKGDVRVTWANQEALVGPIEPKARQVVPHRRLRGARGGPSRERRGASAGHLR